MMNFTLEGMTWSAPVGGSLLRRSEVRKDCGDEKAADDEDTEDEGDPGQNPSCLGLAAEGYDPDLGDIINHASILRSRAQKSTPSSTQCQGR